MNDIERATFGRARQVRAGIRIMPGVTCAGEVEPSGNLPGAYVFDFVADGRVYNVEVTGPDPEEQP